MSEPEPVTSGAAPEAAPATFTVTFQPSGRRGSAAAGADLLSVARTLGVEIESACGGKGTCKKCRVHLESAPGTLTPPTDVEVKALGEEGLATGLRLACQSHVVKDVKVFVPEASRRGRQVVRKEAGAGTVPLAPAVKAYRVKLEVPTLHNATADTERLLAGLEAQHGLTGLDLDFPVLQTLPSACRNSGWDVEAVVWEGRAVIEVRAASAARPVLGLAVDVGTTTIAAYLCDLTTGAVLTTESDMNPQVAFGDDLIARLHYVIHHEGGLQELQRTVMTEVNDLAGKAAARAGATVTDIYDVVMVGNTAMHHLLLGLETRALGVAPFTPAIQGPVDTLASAVGLIFNRGCRLHVLPVEAGFVGADNVAVIIAEEHYKQDKVLLILDIGTNGELVLGNKDRMLSTSCATGPAFEGSHVEFGMRAAPGAIERIRIDPDTLEVRFKVIGVEGWNTEHRPEEMGARGICGSGIIEAAAEMAKAKVILATGNMNPGLQSDRMLYEDGKPRKFVIARAEETALGRPITVGIKDIRSLQLAKAALRAGEEILMRRYGVDKPDAVIMAGAFGTYIDKHHALAIGMLPDTSPGIVSSVGNAAGDGARFALLNLEKRREAAWAARKVEFIELATDPDFLKEYVAAMNFDPDADIPEE